MTNDQVIYDYAMSMVGKPYLWGGDDPMSGWDCSGLALELLKATGFDLPDMTAQDLFDVFENDSDTQKTFGSLAFYGPNTENIRHVAWCLNDSLCLEAGGGGSKITSIGEAMRMNAYVRVRPILHRKDICAIIRPHYRLLKS